MKRKFEGRARFIVEMDYEVELTEEEFNQGRWYDKCLHAATEKVWSQLNLINLDGDELEFDDCEIEAEDLELIE